MIFYMENSLPRLIELARRTGDRLIVSDPKGDKDVVIMTVSQYEELLNRQPDVKTLSVEQLAGKINEEVALWRAHHEGAEKAEVSKHLEEEMRENPLRDPFEEDFVHPEGWHEGEKEALAEPVTEDGGNTEEKEEVEELRYEIPVEEPLPPPTHSSPFSSVGSILASSGNPLTARENWKEEKPMAGEDPVFFEEPVE